MFALSLSIKQFYLTHSAITPSHNGPENDGNEGGTLHSPNSSITASSPGGGGSYTFAEMQFLYITGPAYWAELNLDKIQKALNFVIKLMY